MSLSSSGTEVEGDYQVIVDGVRQSQSLTVAEPEPISVSGGEHLVQVAALGPCSVETALQSVTVTVGGLVPRYGPGEFRGELRSLYAGAAGDSANHRFHNRASIELDPLRRLVRPHGKVGLQSVAKLGR